MMSYAAWYGADDMWLWGMMHNSPTEGGYSDVFFDEEKEVNPEHYVVFLQKSTPFEVDPVGTRAHGNIYRDRPCEMVWLQRHGRDLIHKVGWDGSPQEMQSLYTNGNLHLQAYLWTPTTQKIINNAMQRGLLMRRPRTPARMMKKMFPEPNVRL